MRILFFEGCHEYCPNLRRYFLYTLYEVGYDYDVIRDHTHNFSKCHTEMKSHMRNHGGVNYVIRIKSLALSRKRPNGNSKWRQNEKKWNRVFRPDIRYPYLRQWRSLLPCLLVALPQLKFYFKWMNSLAWRVFRSPVRGVWAARDYSRMKKYK